ncbi:MAG: YcxB family protein [Clostridia bacterium]|nr:YcxB family protein [Clostridia bacterium]
MYLILGQAGVIPYSHIINFIVTAYLVFMLFQFGRVELAIYRYSKQPNTIIGMDIIYSFYNNYFTIEIPSLKEKNNYGIETIMEAVEISSNFILYMNQTQTFIIPKTGMSAEQLSFLRTYLLQNLKSRFSSTVIDRANKAMNAPKKKNLFGKF